MKTLLIKIAQRCNHVEILTSNMTCKKTTTTMTKKKKKTVTKLLSNTVFR